VPKKKKEWNSQDAYQVLWFEVEVSYVKWLWLIQ